jgi:DNA-binding PucR family transcriptional regulator
VEHIHQIAAKIETRTSRMKDKSKQAFVHSKIEAIQNSQEIKSKLAVSKEDAKRNFKKRNIELDSEQRQHKQKLERDSSRLETLELLQQKPDSSLPHLKFKSSR